MSFIALFMPASISMMIRNRRKEKAYSLPASIFEYAVLVLINVFITQSVIVYLLGISEVDMQALNSFPFFTKYTFIAMAIAWLTPYVEEVLCKFIGISFYVEQVDKNDSSKEA